MYDPSCSHVELDTIYYRWQPARTCCVVNGALCIVRGMRDHTKRLTRFIQSLPEATTVPEIVRRAARAGILTSDKQVYNARYRLRRAGAPVAVDRVAAPVAAAASTPSTPSKRATPRPASTRRAATPTRRQAPRPPAAPPGHPPAPPMPSLDEVVASFRSAAVRLGTERALALLRTLAEDVGAPGSVAVPNT